MTRKIWTVVITLLVLLAAFILSDTGRSFLLGSTATVPGEQPRKAEIGPKARILDWVPLPPNIRIHHAAYYEATLQQPESGVVYIESDLQADTLLAEYKKQLKEAGYEIITVHSERIKDVGAKYSFHALDRKNYRSLGVLVFTDENPSRAQIGYRTTIVEPRETSGTVLEYEE